MKMSFQPDPVGIIADMEVAHPFAMSDGFQLFCRRWKLSSVPKGAILCIHGTGENSEFFRPVAEDLAVAGYELYAIDLRGFGLSTETGLSRGDTRSFKRQLEDLVEVIGQIHMQNRPLFLLGHSHGCAYILWCAANHPEHVRGIILAAPPVESTSKVEKNKYLKFALLLLFRPKTMYTFADVRRQTSDPRIPPDSPVARSVSIRWLYGTKKLLNDPLFEHAERTKLPSLILQGNQDTVTLPSGARRLLERLGTTDKDAQFFEGADHFLYDEFVPTRVDRSEPGQGQLVDVLVRWLNRVGHA